MYWFAFIISWLFIRIFYPCKVVGKKNMQKGPAIFVCNHLSNLDVIYIAEYLPYRKHYFLAKKELFTTKFKSKFLKSMGGIPIDRDKADITAIKNSLQVLKNGKKLVIFPEGTRNKVDDNLQEIRSGSAMLAIKSKTPILPLHIQKKGKLFTRNKITVGKPFELTEFYDQKLTNEVLEEASKIITNKMKEIEN